MAEITPVTIATGRSGTHPESFCQLKDTVIYVNGHDANQSLPLKTLAPVDLGLASPGAAPTAANGAAGNVDGVVRYRVRWRSDVDGVMSLASAELTHTAATCIVTVTAPASPPARATHWVLERTIEDGKVFYPVNRVNATPNGTVVATTTFADNVSDAIIQQRKSIPNRQGVPGPYRHCFVNQGRVFMCGAPVVTITAGLTNSNASVTSGGVFTTRMDGQYFSVPGDTDGKMYKFTYTNASAGTISPVYAGTTASKSINIAGNVSRVCWSEPGEPELYGTQEVGILSNELNLDDAGEPTYSGVGLGPAGVLWAKETQLFMHSYTLNPDPVLGDGRIVPVPIRRGVAGKNAMRFINGYVYGMDFCGIWRMAPGGQPEEIATPLAYEWKRGVLNPCTGEKWHIGWDPLSGWIYFYLTINSDTYPQRPFIWDTTRDKWIGSKEYALGVTCSTELFDTNNALRHVFYQENSDPVYSYSWMDNIGKSNGAIYSTSPLNGTVTSGDANTITCSGAVFPTTGRQLLGLEAIKTTIAGTSETRVISANDATSFSTSSNWTATPVAGDTFSLAPIRALYRSPRLDAGLPERKKRWDTLHLKVKYKTSCSRIWVKVYLDGLVAADTDRAVAQSDDGVTYTASGSFVRVDPTNQLYRFEVPLNKQWANDIQFEIYSDEAGEPWEITGMKVIYDADDREVPTRK